MALAALLSGSLSPFVAFSGLIALALPWLIRLPRLAIGFLFLSLLVGQLIRLPLPGQGGGLLLSDLAVVIILLSVCLQLLSSHRKKIPLVILKLIITTTPFILWALFTLVIKTSALGANNTIIAASYWLRLSTLLLLLPALTFLFQSPPLRQNAWRNLYLTITLLTFLGIAQLIFLPNLSPYSSSGWDPHQLRLVSTWIDPNFFGAFLAMGLVVVLLGPKFKTRQRTILALTIIFALFATQSRSTFITLILALLLTTPLFLVLFSSQLTARRLIFFTGALAMFTLLIILIGTILLPRFVGLISIDPTVQARILSIQKAIPIIADNSLLGVGYNAYQFAARDAGAINNFQNHSRAGADNSLLTIWATTGLIGLFLFLIPWTYITQKLFIDLRQFGLLTSFMSILCISILFIHSQFVNSLIYSHLLITLVIITSLSLSTARHRQKNSYLPSQT